MVVRLWNSRGFRQPLVSFLFNIVIEGLCGMRRQAIEKNLFCSFLVRKEKTQINLLQYTDDTLLFFGDASLSNVYTIKSILRGFELILGLKVNFHKSFFRTIRVKDSTLERYASIINYMINKFPFVYLGIPIGANPRREKTWKPILNKIAKLGIIILA